MGKEINDAAYWREFENNQLTHSAAHYLMAIDSLRGDLGYARVTDVADMLEVSRGAASMAIAFFEEVLGAPHDVALSDACKMEHLMSLETGRRLVWLMRYILSDETRAAQVNETMASYKPGSESPESCPLCEGGECLGDPAICAFKAN